MRTILFFALILARISSYSQDTLSVREVFDFNIGDEFHYRDWSEPGNDYEFSYDYQTIKIIKKDINITKDSLIYEQVVTDFRLPQSLDFDPESFYIIKIDTQKISFGNIESSIRDFEPIYNIDTVDKTGLFELYLKDTVFHNSTYLCDSLINGIEYFASWGEFDHFTRYYGKGLGMIYSSSHNAEDGAGYFKRELNYYKKGDNVCGEIYISTATANHVIKDITIFPNPVSDKIHIDIGNSSDNILITIIDLQGKQVDSSWISSANSSINTSGISSGVYFIRFMLNDKLVIRKIIKH